MKLLKKSLRPKMKKTIILLMLAMILIISAATATEISEYYEVNNPASELDNSSGAVIWVWNADDYTEGDSGGWLTHSSLNSGSTFTVPCADLGDYGLGFNSDNCTGNITLFNSTSNYHTRLQPGITLGNNVSMIAKFVMNQTQGTMSFQCGFVEGEDTTKATGYGGYALGTALRTLVSNSWEASGKSLWAVNRYSIIKVRKNTTYTIVDIDNTGEYEDDRISANTENNIYCRWDDIASGHNQFFGIEWIAVCKGDCEIIPITIDIEGFIYPNGSFASISNGDVIEFQNGTYKFLIDIIGNNLYNFYVNITNSTETVLFEDSNLSALFVQSSQFVDFEANPFNITVFANDTNSNSIIVSLVFNISDTADPFCNFSNVFADSGDNISFGVLCEDENFYSLNVSCPANNNTFSVDGLNVEEYWFDWGISFNQSDTCSYTYCDGHTAPELLMDWSVKDVGELEFIVNSRPTGRFWVDRNDILEYNYDIQSGKIVFGFSVEKSSIDNYFTAYYNVSPNSHYFKSDKWLAWIVDSDSRTAFDLNNLGEDATVVNRGKGLWEISWVSKKRSFSFESITELNCVSGSFDITITPLEGLQVGECPSTTAGMLGLWLVVFLGCALIWFSFVSKVGVFGFLGGLIIMVDSWYLAGCSSMIAFIIALVSFIVMLWFVLFFRPYGAQSGGILE